MNNWDELEKAAKSALECGPQVGGYDWNPSSWMNRNEFAYAVKAHPKTVLTLIEQNRELLEALHDIYNEVDGNIEPTVRDLVNQCGRSTPTDPNEIYEYCASIKAVVVEAIRKATGEEA